MLGSTIIWDKSGGMNSIFLYHTDYRYFNCAVFQMLSAFNDIQKPMIELAKCIDPNLTHYHKDSVLQVYRIYFIFFSNFFDIDALLHVFPLLVISYFSFLCQGRSCVAW